MLDSPFAAEAVEAFFPRWVSREEEEGGGAGSIVFRKNLVCTKGMVTCLHKFPNFDGFLDIDSLDLFFLQVKSPILFKTISQTSQVLGDKSLPQKFLRVRTILKQKNS